MAYQKVELKEFHYPSSFLRKEQYGSLLLVLWKNTNFDIKLIPKIYYRLGYYEVDDGDNVVFVNSSELVHVSTYYFCPLELADNPVVVIKMKNKTDKWRLAFIEIYDIDDGSVYYIIPRTDIYQNPYNPDEKVFTEIVYESEVLEPHRQDNQDQDEREPETDSIGFMALLRNISRHCDTSGSTKNLDNKSNPTIINKNRRQDKHGNHVCDIPKYFRKEGDMFGFFWLNESHWKAVQKLTGYCSGRTALPVYLFPYIETFISSIGDTIITNMISNMKQEKIYDEIKDRLHETTSTYCKPHFSVDMETIKDLCILDIVSALFPRREKVPLQANKFDFGNRYGLLSYKGILNGTRTQFDPCDPFHDLHMSSIFSLNDSSYYVHYMKFLAPKLLNETSMQVEDNNIVKIRIIAGKIISITRNGVTYGQPDSNRPPQSMNSLNKKLASVKNITEHQFQYVADASEIVNSLYKNRDSLTYEIITGCNDVETCIYFINDTAIVINPLMPCGMCLCGPWSLPYMKNDISKLKLLSDIFLIFFNYGHFVNEKLDLLEDCMKEYVQ